MIHLLTNKNSAAMLFCGWTVIPFFPIWGMKWGPPLSEEEKQGSSQSTDFDEERALELMYKGLEMEGRQERAIKRPLNDRWPNGVVPYR